MSCLQQLNALKANDWTTNSVQLSKIVPKVEVGALLRDYGSCRSCLNGMYCLSEITDELIYQSSLSEFRSC